jgi:hypothetical protein
MNGGRGIHVGYWWVHKIKIDLGETGLIWFRIWTNGIWQ